MGASHMDPDAGLSITMAVTGWGGTMEANAAAARPAGDAVGGPAAEQERLEQELELARREQAAAEASAARVNAQLQAIRASRSWRITRPLRAFGRRDLDEH